MTSTSFAQLLNDAINVRGVTPGEVSRALKAMGFKIDRGTIRRWLRDEHAPGHDSLEIVRRLPQVIGLSPVDEATFLRSAGELLGLDAQRFAAYAHETAPIPQRIHFGADDLPPFAGRAAELAELRRSIGSGQSVLITGMGGMGKTRLAQELLRHSVHDFAHGCEFLTIAPGQDGVQVLHNVARLLGLSLPSDDGNSPDNRQALDALRRQLGHTKLLFLVDNVEDANQVRDLVQGLRAITWVFTARRVSLKRVGVYALHLRLPNAADAAAIFRAHLSAALIVDRDDDHLVQRVVHKVGGLPFALRLAAAALSNNVASTVAELDAWLDAGGLSRAGSPTRKLERLFAPMLDSLPPTARRALLLCGIFAAPTIQMATAQAVGAAAACRPTLDDWATLEDYSLIEFPDDERVAFHAQLHDHVRRRLRASPDCAAIHAAYLAHYVALAERVGRPPETERDYRPLVAEEQELLAVAEALHAAGDWSGLQRLYPALTGYLWRAGNRHAYAQVDLWCLDAADGLGDEEWTVKILSELGYARKEAGEWVEAEALFQRCQTLYDATPERFIDRARLRRYRAEVALGQGNADGALLLLAEVEELLARAAKTQPPNLVLATMLFHSARMTVHHRRGALAEAEADGRAAEQLFQTTRSYGEFRVELGDILLLRGQADEAARLWQAELDSHSGLPDQPEHTEARLRLAWVWASRGENERAREAAQAAIEAFDRHGQMARAALAGRVLAAADRDELPLFGALLSQDA